MSEPRNKVAAVVVTYNRLQMLKECIASLQAQEYPCDVLVVNNASTDDTEAYMLAVCEQEKQVLYKNTGANLGGAGGFNFGMRWAVEAGYDFVWVMDDDCMPTQQALQVFMDFEAKHPQQYGCLSSKVLWKDNSICKMNVQRATMYKTVKDMTAEQVAICMASFVSLFVPAQIIKAVGLPIKEFFIWTDDWEFTRRISLQYPCWLLTNSVVIHKSASNLGASIVSESLARLDRFDYLYRNDVYLYRREGLQGFLYEAVRLLWHSFLVITKAEDNKAKRLRKIINGTLNGFSFNPVIELVSASDSKQKAVCAWGGEACSSAADRYRCFTFSSFYPEVA